MGGRPGRVRARTYSAAATEARTSTSAAIARPARTPLPPPPPPPLPAGTGATVVGGGAIVERGPVGGGTVTRGPVVVVVGGGGGPLRSRMGGSTGTASAAAQVSPWRVTPARPKSLSATCVPQSSVRISPASPPETFCVLPETTSPSIAKKRIGRLCTVVLLTLPVTIQFARRLPSGGNASIVSGWPCNRLPEITTLSTGPCPCEATNRRRPLPTTLFST